MPGKQKAKQSALALSYNAIKDFEGVLKFRYTGEEMTSAQLAVHMETFARLKRISNPGDLWHVFRKDGEFTTCESKFALNLVMDGWEEIGNIEL